MNYRFIGSLMVYKMLGLWWMLGSGVSWSITTPQRHQGKQVAVDEQVKMIMLLQSILCTLPPWESAPRVGVWLEHPSVVLASFLLF